MLSRSRSVVWVRNGSMERFNEEKFGERGSGVFARDASVGG